jgi:hypothetical protein
MTGRMPPVPPASRSPKGPGSDPKIAKDEAKHSSHENVKEQGEQGNIRQNTTNQGYQQDR